MQVWKNILSQLKQDRPLVLMVVVHSEGSSPGRQGFKMWVGAEGEMGGSIGGGFMEHKLVELSKSLLQKGTFTPFIKRQIHQANIAKDRSGMICSGEQTIAFYYLNNENINFCKNIIEQSGSGQFGSLEMNERGIFFDENILQHSFFLQKNTNEWTYKEPLGFKHFVYIIGAGHVGLAVSQMMRDLGFYVEIFDDREGLNTLIHNKFAHKKQVVEYKKIDQYILEGENIYVILMSFGYKTDELCIQQLIHKKFKYFGVMGSSEKMKTLFASLLQQGYTQADIDRLHSPIGIQINSKTPTEIAVSIAAEIIKVKNT